MESCAEQRNPSKGERGGRAAHRHRGAAATSARGRDVLCSAGIREGVDDAARRSAKHALSMGKELK